MHRVLPLPGCPGDFSPAFARDDCDAFSPTRKLSTNRGRGSLGAIRRCTWTINAHPEVETDGRGGDTMILPGKTEAGSAGTQPCRGIAWRAHRNDEWQRRNVFLARLPNPHRIGRPRCLENPRPKGGILTNWRTPSLHFTLNQHRARNLLIS